VGSRAGENLTPDRYRGAVPSFEHGVVAPISASRCTHGRTCTIWIMPSGRVRFSACKWVTAVAVALVALGGCVESSRPLPPITSSSPSTQEPEVAFPIVIFREGRGAPPLRFTVDSDGKVHGNPGSRDGTTVLCTLGRDGFSRLNHAALKISPEDRPSHLHLKSMPPQSQLLTVVSVGGGSTLLADPRLASAVQTVEGLLADAEGRASSRSVCHRPFRT
jgi:hypothetical protein